MNSAFRWLASTGLLPLVLAGCGGAASDSQIAVRVNKGEVSIHQVQAVIQRQPPALANDPGDRVANRVLELLIDQELAAQASREMGLEKDPRTVQLLEAARREVLARTYQERIAQQVRSPSSDEIDRYYAQHPQLFAQRKLYVLRETAVDPAADRSAVEAIVRSSQSMADVEAGLRQAKVRFSGRLLAHAAEDLPLSLLERVSPVAIGQSVFIPSAGAARIFTVLDAIDAPIDERTASAAIATYLSNERKGAVVAEAMKKLRDEAKIEYVGSFAQGAGAPATRTPAPGAASGIVQ